MKRAAPGIRIRRLTLLTLLGALVSSSCAIEPWQKLQERFSASSTDATAAGPAQRVTLVLSGPSVRDITTLMNVSLRLSEATVHLEPRAIENIVNRALSIPPSAVERCRRGSHSVTTLAIRGLETNLEISDPSGALWKWCEAHGL